jgi:hypothetical protein
MGIMSGKTSQHLGSFMREFPDSVCFKGDNPEQRGQVFFQHRDDKLVEELLAHSPSRPVVTQYEDKEVEKHLSSPAFFGRGPRCACIGTDYHGVASVRVVTDGMLRVVVGDLQEVSRCFATETNAPASSVSSLVEFLHGLSNERLIQLLPTSLKSLRGGIVAAGCSLYVPCGALLCEKSLRQSFVFGIRPSLVIAHEGAAQDYEFFLSLMPKCETPLKKAALEGLATWKPDKTEALAPQEPGAGSQERLPGLTAPGTAENRSAAGATEQLAGRTETEPAKTGSKEELEEAEVAAGEDGAEEEAAAGEKGAEEE